MGILPPRREAVFGVPLSSLEVGQRTEAFIVHRLMECGYTVLTMQATGKNTVHGWTNGLSEQASQGLSYWGKAFGVLVKLG